MNEDHRKTLIEMKLEAEERERTIKALVTRFTFEDLKDMALDRFSITFDYIFDLDSDIFGLLSKEQRMSLMKERAYINLLLKAIKIKKIKNGRRSSKRENKHD